MATPSTAKVPPKTISGGVLNGKAVSLPKPPYPPAARAVRASGAVTVQVLVDEGGRVASATAISGHPLLRSAAVEAARSAIFSPTLLAGKPVFKHKRGHAMVAEILSDVVPFVIRPELSMAAAGSDNYRGAG